MIRLRRKMMCLNEAFMAVRPSPIKFRHTPVLNSCNDAKGRRIETLRLSEFHSKGAIPW